MSSSEFTEMIAYFTVEMPEPFRSDNNFASIVQTLININRAKGKKPISLNECKLNFDSTPEDHQTKVQRLMKNLKMFFHSMGIKKTKPEDMKHKGNKK